MKKYTDLKTAPWIAAANCAGISVFACRNKKGIEKACEICGKPDSLAFDTWGVDYGLIDGAGKIMGLPANYRDPRTKNMPDKAYEKYRRKSFMQPREIKLCP